MDKDKLNALVNTFKNGKKFLTFHDDLVFKTCFGLQSDCRFTEFLLEGFLQIPDGSLKGLEVVNSIKLTKEVVVNKSFEIDGAP